MKTATIVVENLKCGGCANTVKKNLDQIDKVECIGVNLDTSEVSVSFDGDADYAMIIATLGKLGYPEVGNGSTVSTMKSYVSCALGRMNA